MFKPTDAPKPIKAFSARFVFKLGSGALWGARAPALLFFPCFEVPALLTRGAAENRQLSLQQLLLERAWSLNNCFAAIPRLLCVFLIGLYSSMSPVV